MLRMAMSGGGVARWLLTVSFTGTGLYYLARVAVATLRHRVPIDEGLHAVMSAAMVAMWWSWGTAVPAIGYVTAFTAATLWFAGRALFTTPALGQPAPHRSVRPGHAGHRGALWYHAAMMASMAWMATAMAGMSGPPPAGTGPATPADGGMTAMAGMAMAPTGPGRATRATTATAPPWATVPCLILAVAFGAATIWLASTAFRSAARPGSSLDWRGAVVSNLAGALMAAGMAVSFYEMF